MDARATIPGSYDAPRAGDPLGPYIADERPGDDSFVNSHGVKPCGIRRADL